MAEHAILEPGDHPPRPGERPILDIRDLSLEALLAMARPAGGVLFIDLETQGTQVWQLDRRVVGVALADDSGACYLHIGVEPEAQALWGYFLQQLYHERTPLVAHNVQFDSAWMARDLSLVLKERGPMQGPSSRQPRAEGTRHDVWEDGVAWHNWYACSLAAYKHLASEGFVGQRHGLKEAMVQMLGWGESNEGELDAWLCDNGYGRWQTEKATGARKAQPDKGEMWRAPPGILGKYAALDVEATYLLWNRILKPAWDLFDAYREYHQTWLCGPHGLQRHLVWQKLRGVAIDVQSLSRLQEGLTRRLSEIDSEFRAHPQVAEHIAAYDAAKVAEVRTAEPPRWKKLPKLSAEPPRTKKDGSPSAAWAKWEEKRDYLQRIKCAIELVEEGAVPSSDALEYQSYHWTQWHCRLKEATTTKWFNPNSDYQLRWLFHDRLGYPVLVMTDHETNPQPSVAEDALKGFGEAGALLIQYAGLEKLKQSVESLQKRLADGTDGLTYHPELRVPGTHTGRLSGSGGYNFQNVPKSKEVLECFVARPGRVLMFADIAALEPAVLAQRSQDATYMTVYGPNAKPTDIYLQVAAQLGGNLGAKIRATGFDPANPTPEAVAKAKKEAKVERNIAKLLHLSAGYGAGPGKIREGLGQQGVEMSLAEAKRMHGAYWQLFSQVKAFGRWLEAQWERNGGWWLNGLGLPQCVAEDFKQDIINRDIQATGHSCFMLFALTLAQELEARGIWYAPWNWDLHDCCALECRAEDLEAVREVVDKVVPRKVAEVLGGDVRLKWEANFVACWAEDKTESASVTEQGVRLT